MADERKRFYKGSGIAKHREWRGLKDTFYDYLQWVVNLGILAQFAAKSPVRIVKGLFEYRWFGAAAKTKKVPRRSARPGAENRAHTNARYHEGHDRHARRQHDRRPPLRRHQGCR